MVADNWDSAEDPLYRRILGIFWVEAASLLAGIDAALAQENRAVLVQLTHVLRGISGNVCAMSLHESSGRLEDAAPTAVMAELQRLFETLAQDWHLVKQSIEVRGL